MSVDIAPLKTPDGPHHDIGQFYLLIDPASYSGDAFWDSIEALSSQLDDEPDARLPGALAGPGFRVEPSSTLLCRPSTQDLPSSAEPTAHIAHIIKARRLRSIGHF